MKGPAQTNGEAPASDGDKAQTPQPLKHKIAAADLEAPNSEPQPKHKKLNEELSDEEFERGLDELRSKEIAKRLAGCVSPNPRGKGDAEVESKETEKSEDKPEDAKETTAEENGDAAAEEKKDDGEKVTTSEAVAEETKKTDVSPAAEKSEDAAKSEDADAKEAETKE